MASHSLFLLPLRPSTPLALPLLSPHSRLTRAAVFRGRGRRSARSWTPLAAGEGAIVSVDTASPDLTLSSVVSTTRGGDDAIFSTVISSLFFLAFVALSILTVGVIYLVVQDFLQKREKDKFAEAEAEKKKEGKKGKAKAASRARTGPRGFGQKVEEAEDDD